MKAGLGVVVKNVGQVLEEDDLSPGLCGRLRRRSEEILTGRRSGQERLEFLEQCIAVVIREEVLAVKVRRAMAGGAAPFEDFKVELLR